jgi:large-conductance mechanosensitive channel
MLKGFRDFILRGNVVDLAVAVVIGVAFTAIVNALVADIINPLISAVVRKPDFSFLILHVRDQVWRLSQRADFLSDHRRDRVLYGRAAGQHPAQQVSTQGRGSSYHQTLPTMPE